MFTLGLSNPGVCDEYGLTDPGERDGFGLSVPGNMTTDQQRVVKAQETLLANLIQDLLELYTLTPKPGVHHSFHEAFRKNLNRARTCDESAVAHVLFEATGGGAGVPVGSRVIGAVGAVGASGASGASGAAAGQE
jgi:hypothetical protein